MKPFLKAYILELALVWSALGLYFIFPFGDFEYTPSSGMYFKESNAVKILFYLACSYTIIAVLVVFKKQKANELTKAVFLLDSLSSRSYSLEVKHTFLFYLVKFFFIPLMVPATVYYFNRSLDIFLYSVITDNTVIGYFNGFVFPLLVNVIATIALAYYSFGYLVDSTKLKSKVKSVEPTMFGWIVVLICYAPFFWLAIQVIPFHTKDIVFFVNQEVTFIVRIGLLFVMLFKVWSIASLGAKCSNLTNRGIVSKGPYKWIRHPHYLAKLIVWWVTFLPVLIHNYWAIGSMIFWTMIYVLRALTEENHLQSDKDYVEYCSKVKWRFIPYVF